MSNILAITYSSGVTVTKSDTTDDPLGPFAGFYTGSGGNIAVIDERGVTQTYASAAAGVIMPVAIRRVLTTGTVATSVLGMLAMPYKGKALP